MIQKIIIAGIFTITLLSSSCNRDRCFYGAGKEVQTELLRERFNEIHVCGTFNIELVQDTTYFVEGIGGSNVLDNLELDVKNDTLTMYNYNNCFWFREYKRPHIRIHFSDIKRINLYETSYVYSNDSITDDFWLTIQTMLAEVDLLLNNQNFFFYVHHVTGGKYTFRGKTAKLYLDGYYSSVYDASGLESKVATVKNHSIADYKVWVTDEFHAEVYNRGNIYYKGSPTVYIDTIASTGKVLPIQ